MADNAFENEIAVRNQLRKKVASREKLTQEEKQWLDTHKEFSQILGIPYLKKDIISLEKDANYQFRVSFLKATHPLMIAPCFKAPVLEGNITTDMELYDFYGKKSKSKAVKILVTHISKENSVFTFSYHSKLGALCVYFFCEYDDRRQHLRMRRSSDSWEGLYMLRRDINENTVLYQCKSDGAEEYDSLIFLVEWCRISENL